MTNYVHVINLSPSEVFGMDAAAFAAITAIGTLFIAALSVWISARTAKKQRQMVEHQIHHNHLGVTPVLNFSMDIALASLSEYLGVSITNSGMGPAAMRPPLVFLDGNPVGFLNSEDVATLRARLSIPRSVNIYLIGGGRVLRPSETLRLFWFGQSDIEGVRWVKKFSSRINIIVSYSSLYEHQFMIIGMHNPVDLADKYIELVPDYNKPFITQNAL